MYNSEITDVFFDLDHTLWDFDRNSGLAFQRVFQNHKIKLSLSQFLREYEPINLAYWKQYREERITKEELRRGRLSETFDVLKMKYSLEIIDALADSYIDELSGDNHLFVGTFEILDYLSERYQLHIITNGFKEVQHLKLRNSGIKNYFRSVTTSEEVGLKKPHPSVFNAALKKASVAPEKSIMIGDSFEADIVGANNAGMHTLFFNYRKEKVSPPFTSVNELLQIKEYL
ncbi:YjjG family noncanonical pyrimidine nucleotidase [Aequorivita capsosiphonis]|uniref:YjjG family noncanonical pyrimidine nucleotidase n=1 Tax=Aequorivita capsosiphonis TaxID=487317 RepID=UPI000412FDB4|nr:YjjG family noncanonical pyrimidine nucleotidase [Aequorivita capsosiphonis]